MPGSRVRFPPFPPTSSSGCARGAACSNTIVARTVNILHGYRNQLYHAGLMHEGILHVLAVFHLRIVCVLMSTNKDSSLSYGFKMKLPHRAAKYLGMPPFTGKDVHALVRDA